MSGRHLRTYSVEIEDSDRERTYISLVVGSTPAAAVKAACICQPTLRPLVRAGERVRVRGQ